MGGGRPPSTLTPTHCCTTRLLSVGHGLMDPGELQDESDAFSAQSSNAWKAAPALTWSHCDWSCSHDMTQVGLPQGVP
jgi:hypothetical protein